MRCAQCQGALYQTRLTGQPRQEDHEPGCQTFSTAIQVAQYAGELKQAGSQPNQGDWRRNRRWRKYLHENAKKLSVAACESDPAATVGGLSNQYQAECQAPGTPADTTLMAEMLMMACQQLAAGEAPAPILSGS